MVSIDAGANTEAAVTDLRMSTVVPAEVAGDSRVHELANMDLALKLHYLRMVHYFPAGGAAGGLTVPELKEPMFRLLVAYYVACGRIRQSESGKRPVIKCNDSGVRVVEARCGVSMDEWLAKGDHRHVVSDKVIGPDMHFSPLILIQFTRFKCGGLAVGVSWSHLLGDAVSAANFVHMYGKMLSGYSPPRPHHLQNPPARPKTTANTTSPAATTKPLSIRQVKTLPDRWLPTNERKMGTFSFCISVTQVELLLSKIARGRTSFEAISALIWHCLAKFRGSNREPMTVTICKTSPRATRRYILSNEQAIGTVRADLSPSHEAQLPELANLIAEGVVDETRAIEAQVETETGGPDLIVYGANLTFVDLEDIEAYGFEMKGQAPTFVNYTIEGVGDEGAVLVFQGPPRASGDSPAAGRTVNAILPDDEILHLKKELEREWGINA